MLTVRSLLSAARASVAAARRSAGLSLADDTTSSTRTDVRRPWLGTPPGPSCRREAMGATGAGAQRSAAGGRGGVATAAGRARRRVGRGARRGRFPATTKAVACAAYLQEVPKIRGEVATGSYARDPLRLVRLTGVQPARLPCSRGRRGRGALVRGPRARAPLHGRSSPCAPDAEHRPVLAAPHPCVIQPARRRATEPRIESRESHQQKSIIGTCSRPGS